VIFLNRKTGVIITQFMIVAPVLIGLIIIAFDFGWYGIREAVVINVTRQACRMGCRGLDNVSMIAYIGSHTTATGEQIEITVLDQDHNPIDPDDRTFGNLLIVEVEIPNKTAVLGLSLNLWMRQEFMIESGG